MTYSSSNDILSIAIRPIVDYEHELKNSYANTEIGIGSKKISYVHVLKIWLVSLRQTCPVLF